MFWKYFLGFFRFKKKSLYYPNVIAMLDECEKIKISEDFSKITGPRYSKEWYFSGEEFRDKFLIPKLHSAMENKKKLIVDFDGGFGYGCAFLEESFGGLVRLHKFSTTWLKATFIFVSNEEPHLIDEVKKYILDAERREFEKIINRTCPKLS